MIRGKNLLVGGEKVLFPCGCAHIGKRFFLRSIGTRTLQVTNFLQWYTRVTTRFGKGGTASLPLPLFSLTSTLTHVGFASPCSDLSRAKPPHHLTSDAESGRHGAPSDPLPRVKSRKRFLARTFSPSPFLLTKYGNFRLGLEDLRSIHLF